MNINPLKPSWPAALLATAALAAAAPAALVAADSTAPTPSARAARPDDADLDEQLEAARRKLEQAANEVAQLSTQLSTSAMERITPLLTPGRVIIGVQLEPAGDAGARVSKVSPGGPAQEAGIRAGDVVVAVNGTSVAGAAPAPQVARILHDVKPDGRVSVRVLRDGKPRDFTLTARAVPDYGLPDMVFGALPELRGAFMFHRPLMDMELATLTPQLGSYFGSDKGVLVVRAPADRALKLEDGDVILAIDGRAPTSGSHATRILGSYQPGEKVTLRILRQHKTQDIEVVLPERPSPLHKEMMRRAGALAETPESQHRKLVIFGSDAA